MEYFSNMSFNICGEDETLDVWLKNDISPMKNKKRKENNGAEKAREVKRHKQLDKRQIDRTEVDKHERNTKKSTVWAMNALRDWSEEKKLATDFDSYDAESLNKILRSFYASVRNVTGKPYSGEKAWSALFYQ